MKPSLKGHKPIFTILTISSLLVNCQPSNNEKINEALPVVDTMESKWQKEEEEVKQATDELLFNVGNYNHQAVIEASFPDANIGIASIVEDVPQGRSMTLQAYIDRASDRSKQRPYYEPPHRYTVVISEGRLAFVRAECILHRLGVRQTFEDDFFTFMKVGDQWKLLSASFTAKKLPEEEQVFDLEAFAKSYAQSWGSTRPEFVALYFSKNGSLRVNDGDAAIGREQIAGVAQSFMIDLPDMRVRFDSLVNEPDRLEFHWTLIATHAASDNNVNVSGYEEWTLSEDNLILASQGHFPSDLYNEQIETNK